MDGCFYQLPLTVDYKRSPVFYFLEVDMNYDVIIIGAGPGGIFSAYELTKLNSDIKIAVFEAGHALNKRKCPIDGDKIKTCIGCKSCSIMS